MKLIAFLLLFMSHTAFSSVLRDIDSASDEAKTFTTISFDSAYNEKYTLKNEGSFVEIVLPNVTVEQPGIFYDAKSPFFTKIAPFQLNNNDAAIRFFVKENKLHIEKAIKVSITKQTMMVELDHNVLSNKSDLADKTMPSATEVISKTKVRKDIEDPAKNIVAEKSEGITAAAGTVSAKTKVNKIDYKKYLNIMAGLLAIGMFIFLGISFYKNRSGNMSDLLDVSKENIKTLATYPISQKQQLKLVEVAGEKILLGVSGDSINYLKTINDAVETMPQQAVERSPLKLERTFEKPSLNLEAKASPNNAKKASPYTTPKRDVQADNIAMKMLNKESTDFSDEKNVEIKTKKKKSPSRDTKVASKAKRNDKAVEDVTKLIRKKLQNLPKV